MKNLLIVSLICAALMFSVVAVHADSGNSSDDDSANKGDSESDDDGDIDELDDVNEDDDNGAKIETETENEDGKIKIKQKIKSKGVEAESELEVEQEEKNETGEGKVKVKLSNGRNSEIKIMPDVASQIALEILGSKNFTIQLKEVGKGDELKAEYFIIANETGKVIGLFKVKLKLEAEINAENGEIISVKKPWWVFLVVREKVKINREGNETESENKAKIILCHIPPGNPADANTIIVGASAIKAHLGHGDYLGTCKSNVPGNDTNVTIECTSESQCVSIGKCVEGVECSCVQNKCYQGFPAINETNTTNISYSYSCAVDDDCKLVNEDLGYSCCWAGACQERDYSEEKWIAVNKDKYDEDRSASCPILCGPGPACASSIIPVNVTVSCVNEMCKKTLI